MIGSGAREHALAWKCMESPLVDRVYCAPGNGGTGGMARNMPIPADHAADLVRFAKREKLGLVVLGPEAAVAAGVGDWLRDVGIPVFGPNRGPGRIESSKAFAKQVMIDAGIPTAAYGVFTEAVAAQAWARKLGGKVAVKADGLALGKGVVVCHSTAESDAAIAAMLVDKEFGRAGSTVVVEELLEGPELSFHAVTDGTNVVPLAASRDFKRARDGDEGPNTGGMGAYSPPIGVSPELLTEVMERVMLPAVNHLRESGLEYRGVLYAGLMLTPAGLKVLEFNARFGDPETQVILPRLQSDLVPLMLMAARGDISSAPELKWSTRKAVALVVASGGYPDDYETGF
ncbi:MAG TPA: phosphoribosylamine--glycine ligase, partial [Candidatus Dormibacteraeota bacterium]|nr:phosphoribosylamine--glycine ligase [Candidatus Dormibacteraeota bacterium]